MAPQIKKPKLLITGSSGFLGDTLCRLAVKCWSVYGQFRSQRPPCPKVVPVQADLCDDRALVALVVDILPHALIHTAAESSIMVCERHPKQTFVINSRVPERLAELCAHHGIDYLFTSSDLVFDGQHAPYHEYAQVKPTCAYGHQKVEAETTVLKMYPEALVCRLPLLIGLPSLNRHNYTVQMLTAINDGNPINLFVDEFRTPVDASSAARGILALLGKSNGLLHLGGRSRISRYALGGLMAMALKCPANMLRPVAMQDLDLNMTRPLDCSLVSDRAYGLGYDPLPIKKAVEMIAHQFLQRS